MFKEYETIFVLDPAQDEAQVDAEIQKVSEIITNAGGEILAVNKWGRRKLAYEIRKKKEGIYTLIHFKGTSAGLQDLNRRYNLLKNETLLRSMTVLYEAPPEQPVVPEAAGVTTASTATAAGTTASTGTVEANAESASPGNE